MNYVLWRGPSAINNDPVRVVLHTGGKTRQLGGMPEVYYLHDEVDPGQAKKAGKDEAVCGDCTRRTSGAKGGVLRCYVILYRGPRAVWHATKDMVVDLRSGLLAIHASPLRLRFGAYGDPAAAPVELLEQMVRATRVGWTGYTHQWRTRPDLQRWLMASVDSEEEYHEAKAMGWRTYRGVQDNEELRTLPGEVWCPTVKNPAITCAVCGACSGLDGQGTKDYAATNHGHGITKHGKWVKRTAPAPQMMLPGVL